MTLWTIVDYTNGKGGGYLQLQYDGQRVCDFFPHARDADEAWIRARAKFIMDTMNGDVGRAERERCAEIARSLGLDSCAAAIEMGATVQRVHA